ncbi:MAG TPA: tyrosine--tRNA ligase [Verrucomicrobiales bacterium]|nr:tyrosine--tRNA ligase [Verrucomicrobiales bacterium]
MQNKPDIFHELQWRGLVEDYTGRTEGGAPEADGLPSRLRSAPLTLYCGFDPTADSLHAGSLVPLLALRRFQLAGHHPVAVAGGATGSIGDPSGKAQERQLLTKDQIAANVAAIRPQLARLLDFEADKNPARLVDNADWLGPVSFLDFLRDVGKHFTVNQMVAKESVRARMEDREVGISYTEFSYMLLQAYDFYHLARVYGCELQIGGSDQWGNITAGMELIRKKLERKAYGLTLPLITKADGTKFGKTESGTVWLCPKRTSVYQFYQFWIHTDDRDVIRYLKYFTFLTQDEVTALEAAHAANPGAREAHTALAKAVTAIVHGDPACAEAVRASGILFGGSLDGITPATLDILRTEVPAAAVTAAALSAGLPLTEALMTSTLSPSKGQARKDIDGGGIYVNGQRCQDSARTLSAGDLLHDRAVILRKGKKAYALLLVSE